MKEFKSNLDRYELGLLCFFTIIAIIILSISILKTIKEEPQAIGNIVWEDEMKKENYVPVEMLYKNKEDENKAHMINFDKYIYFKKGK